MYPEQFPRTAVRPMARGVLFLSAWVLTLGLVVSAKGGTTDPKSSARPTAKPVARLLSTSEMVVGGRTRARTVSAERARPNVYATPARTSYAAPAYRAPVRAAVAVAASGEERRVLELVNAERRRQGLEPFELDGELMNVARQHSRDMARQGFFDHIGRDGRTPSMRAEAAGVRGWRMYGENIAYNQGYEDPAAFAVERWMLSAKHRSNILSRSYTLTGLGIARADDGRIFFTQVFMVR
ncbi:MAG TPA: CAP domain-containing protein [Pyrinomonadaceae bacterium]|nr:CAP domain-containing protein [Pyrinomonadaceae bacterium]